MREILDEVMINRYLRGVDVFVYVVTLQMEVKSH